MVLVICTILSLAMANASFGPMYVSVWQGYAGGLSLEHWINDGLMAIFFLFIGLELERELYSGELSQFKNALLPIVAAIGGMVVPALIHFSVNAERRRKPEWEFQWQPTSHLLLALWPFSGIVFPCH